MRLGPGAQCATPGGPDAGSSQPTAPPDRQPCAAVNHRPALPRCGAQRGGDERHLQRRARQRRATAVLHHNAARRASRGLGRQNFTDLWVSRDAGPDRLCYLPPRSAGERVFRNSSNALPGVPFLSSSPGPGPGGTFLGVAG